MLWLTWHMWILLLLAFIGGVITGWVLRSRSDEPEDAPRLGYAETPADPAPAQSKAAGSPAPDPKSAMAMTAPVQAPGADAGPVGDGPQGETSAGAGAPEGGPDDDLTRIKGLGPKAAEKLNEAGVTTIGQIAAWSDSDVTRYDTLINGRGRIERDDWVGQAKQMAG